MPDDDTTSTASGNQTGYPLASDPEVIYNPGYPAGEEGSVPRDPLATEGAHDLSPGAKRTLGSYLSQATKGNVGTSRPNTFQIP